MSEFEDGQRVRCIDNYGAESSLTQGRIYEVSEHRGGYVFLLGRLGGWLPHRFELVNDGVDPSVYAHARTNDPATSKGKRRVNQYEQSVLTYLSLYREDGGTGKEIAGKHTALNCITPRFAPLRRKGLIKDSGQRRDKQIVWTLV
jgi:hypothetical protein